MSSTLIVKGVDITENKGVFSIMEKVELHSIFSQATGCHPNGDGLRAFQEALTEDQLIKYVVAILDSGSSDEISRRAVAIGADVTDLMLMTKTPCPVDPVFAGGMLAGMMLTNHVRMEAAVRIIQGLAPVKP